MENLAADFIIDFNNPIEAEFELSEGGYDCSFELFAAGTVWGSISGTLSNQTDLQATLDLKANKTELNTTIQNEATTRAENDTLLQNNINTLSQTVTANYNTLDGKIDTEISDRTAADTTLTNSINSLSNTVTSNYNSLDGRITTNANNILTINTTISGYGNIVTHNTSEFATSAQGALADSALQLNDNISELINDVGYITSSALPTDYVPETRTINGYALSQNITLNYSDVGALPSTTTINDLTTTAQQNALNSGATSTNIAQITTNENDILTINGLIPTQASSSNQLADKNFVNSSIATNTANFIGTFNSVADLEAYSGTLTNNDYAFVVGTDSAGNTVYDRYKYTDATTPPSWIFEYELNNSSFTAAQWDAINSGITSGDVSLIGTALQPNDNISELTNDVGYITSASLPTVNNGTLTIQKNGTNVQTFTANSSTDVTANITVPTDTNDLTNGAGFITSSALNGYATESWVGNQGYITGITSGDVTTALGYTPYNSSNPDGYITSSALTNYVTTNTAQNISARKTFLGEKAIYFKQNTTSNKLGFTLYNPSNSELGAFEYRPNTINGGALLSVNTPASNSDYVGFRYWGGDGINIVAPRPSTTGNYFIPIGITDGTNTVTANSTGTVDISSLISGGGTTMTYDSTTETLIFS